MVATMPRMATVTMSSIRVKPPSADVDELVCLTMRDISMGLSLLDPGQTFGLGVRRKIDLLRARRSRNRLIDDVGRVLVRGHDVHATGRIGLHAGLLRIRHHRAIWGVSGERVGEDPAVGDIESVG